MSEECKDCKAHSGVCERQDAIEAAITNRLTLMIWIVGVGFGLNIMVSTYLLGALSSLGKADIELQGKIETLRYRTDQLERELDAARTNQPAPQRR